jgi:hypothetical protein
MLIAAILPGGCASGRGSGASLAAHPLTLSGRGRSGRLSEYTVRVLVTSSLLAQP